VSSGVVADTKQHGWESEENSLENDETERAIWLSVK